MRQRQTITLELTGEECDAILGAIASREVDLEDRIHTGDRVADARREIGVGDAVVDKINEALRT